MYVIVGASSGVGRAIAETFAAQGCDLLLASRDERDTRAVASDLMLRFGVSVKTVTLDLSAPEPDFSEILDVHCTNWGGVEGLLIPAGSVSNVDTVDIDAPAIDALFRVNCLSVCKLISELLKAPPTANAISIVGFGSIAATRGRGSNMIYSAAKTAMRFYFESLRHACAERRVVVQFYVLGYIDTNLAFAYDVPFPKGDARQLARRVYRDIHKDIGVCFFPRYWLIISMLVKLVPWPIYRRLKF